MLALRFITAAGITVEEATDIIFWLGITTHEELYVLKGRSIRQLESLLWRQHYHASVQGGKGESITCSRSWASEQAHTTRCTQAHL